jgi:hypothetical protein
MWDSEFTDAPRGKNPDRFMAHRSQRLTGALELRHRRWQSRSLPDRCRITAGSFVRARLLKAVWS